MEDSNLAFLNNPNGEFAGENIPKYMSKTWVWMASGPKSTKMGNEHCILDATGGFKLLKNNKIT